MSQSQDDEERTEALKSPWVQFRSAPLTPIALAVLAGVLLDAYFPGPVILYLVGTGLFSLIAYKLKNLSQIIAVILAVANLSAAHHQFYCTQFPANDMAQHLTPEGLILRVRGMLEDDLVQRRLSRDDPSLPAQPASITALLEVQELRQDDGNWMSTSGLVIVSIEPDEVDLVQELQAGDEVELSGLFRRVRGPGNPGERDSRERHESQRIRAEARVLGSQSITRLSRSPRVFPRLRRYFTGVLQERLNPAQVPLARALLLGDGQSLRHEDWQAYIRTGVVHALIISGQHLAILAWFLWFTFWVFQVSQRRIAIAVLVVIMGYTILTGAHPSGVRAAAMVSAFCGSLLLRRRMHLANSFCLSFIMVVILNPTDVFNLGCQLSFLAVFVLLWGARHWMIPTPKTPIEKLIDDARPWWLQRLRNLARLILWAYITTVIVTLAILPRLLHENNLFSLAGLVIGPVVVLLTTIGLVAGFLLLILGWLPFLPSLIAVVVNISLQLCDAVVKAADAFPFASVSLVSLPLWWMFAYYSTLIVLILKGFSLRMVLLVLGSWFVVGMLWPTSKAEPGELRVTLLSVGRGNCIVLEGPDGRCLIYDIGCSSGPGFVRRIVAPYLWHRGISRVDDVFISHADTDHFNGLEQLLNRFPVGQVTLTPSFAEKPTREVASTLLALQKFKLPPRIAWRGDVFQAGEVELLVLHPPEVGPPGIENERSLVLQIRFAGQVILLTGDLEKSGTSSLLQLAPQKADVLLAPHHGNRAALPTTLLNWCEPSFLVVSRGTPFGNTAQTGPDTGQRLIWDTDSCGAITLRVNRTGIVAESFRTGERLVVTRRKPPP